MIISNRPQNFELYPDNRQNNYKNRNGYFNVSVGRIQMDRGKTEGERERQTQRQRQKETGTWMELNLLAEVGTDRDRQTETDRQTDHETESKTGSRSYCPKAFLYKPSGNM